MTIKRFASDFPGPHTLGQWLMGFGVYIDPNQIAGWCHDAQSGKTDWKITLRYHHNRWHVKAEKHAFG